MQPGRDIVAEVLVETLEQFALLFCDPVDGAEIQSPDTSSHGAVIRFRAGTRTGDFAIAASAALCREMAANILGEEPDEITEAMMDDSVKELTNVLLGDIAVRCFGTETVCEMDTPEICSLEGNAVVAMAADPETVCMSVDDELLIARFRVH